MSDRWEGGINTPAALVSDQDHNEGHRNALERVSVTPHHFPFGEKLKGLYMMLQFT